MSDRITVRFGDLPSVLSVPPVADFLDAADRAMNSNTLLLPFEVDGPALDGPDAMSAVVGALLGSDAFSDAMYAIDRARGWDNHHDGDVIDGAWVRTPRPGRWCIDGAPVIRALTPSAVRARLRWMLTEAPSPYRTRPPIEQAGALADGFARWLLPGGAAAIDLVPSFLACTADADDPTAEPPPLAYFDGRAADTATLVRSGRRVRLLLTNGCP